MGRRKDVERGKLNKFLCLVDYLAFQEVEKLILRVKLYKTCVYFWVYSTLRILKIFHSSLPPKKESWKMNKCVFCTSTLYLNITKCRSYIYYMYMYIFIYPKKKCLVGRNHWQAFIFFNGMETMKKKRRQTCCELDEALVVLERNTSGIISLWNATAHNKMQSSFYSILSYQLRME